jgi:predicted nucleic acid-binding protein
VAKYALDTNVYALALASTEAADELSGFLRGHVGETFLHAVVMQELRVGARTPAQVTALVTGVIEPFARRGRLIVPSARAFLECGRVLVDLIVREGLVYAETGRSLVNDVLIATSCREHGVVLITRDRDFERIGRYVRGLRTKESFPR